MPTKDPLNPIRLLRLSRRESKQEFALATGVSERQVYNWEMLPASGSRRRYSGIRRKLGMPTEGYVFEDEVTNLAIAVGVKPAPEIPDITPQDALLLFAKAQAAGGITEHEYKMLGKHLQSRVI